MQHSDFMINGSFFSATGQWLCTDIGTRVITAIKFDENEKTRVPPYDVQEIVFDEYDFDGCSIKPCINT
ncbi:MAG: hypothetical protein QM504_15310 [Pseudomonadota bacterium]